MHAWLLRTLIFGLRGKESEQQASESYAASLQPALVKNSDACMCMHNVGLAGLVGEEGPIWHGHGFCSVQWRPGAVFGASW